MGERLWLKMGVSQLGVLGLYVLLRHSVREKLELSYPDGDGGQLCTYVVNNGIIRYRR